MYENSSYRYLAYGITILSDIELPELTPETKDTPPAGNPLYIREVQQDISMNGADAGAIFEAEMSRFRWPAVGAFQVDATGTSISIWRQPGVQDELLAFPLLGPVLFDVLRRRGLFVLHASAVMYHGHAVAFLADKGGGKSTTATGLLADNALLLADDLVAIDAKGQVHPGFGQVKLSDEARSLLPGDVYQRGHVHEQIDKHRILLGAGRFRLKPTPLKRLYLLGRASSGGGAVIEQLDDGMAFPAAMRFSYAARFSTELLQGAVAAAHFQAAAALARTCTFRRLLLPHGLDRMPEVRRAIATDLAEDTDAQ